MPGCAIMHIIRRVFDDDSVTIRDLMQHFKIISLILSRVND